MNVQRTERIENESEFSQIRFLRRLEIEAFDSN